MQYIIVEFWITTCLRTTLCFFSIDNLDVVYIEMCDCVEVECLQEVMPPLYGFAKEQDATNPKEMC
jgi:hypothetical protein